MLRQAPAATLRTQALLRSARLIGDLSPLTEPATPSSGDELQYHITSAWDSEKRSHYIIYHYLPESPNSSYSADLVLEALDKKLKAIALRPQTVNRDPR